ncbi:hypothetical protein R3P38DRAFT_2555036, partial [Favolaschia claudopus]
WALSTDGTLRSLENSTSIDYEERFNQYLEILTKGLRQKKKSILHIFREWDRNVFPNSEGGLGGSVRSRASDGGNLKALDALNDDSEVEAKPMDQA